LLKCRNIVDDADLLVARELPWQRRMEIQLHLLFCTHCRRYVRQLRPLINAVPFMHSKATDQEVSDIMKKCSESGDP
jgi:hypothetical protein